MKVMMRSVVGSLSFLSLFVFSAKAQTLQGPNVNPSNLAVLVEWEKFTGRKADIIGDNFSAHTWDVLRDATSFRQEGTLGAVAEQLRRWQSAFDEDGVLHFGEGDKPYLGRPKGRLFDYELELAIPMFPNYLTDESGNEVEASQVPDRWQMGRVDNRHHSEAKRAFRALAAALVHSGMTRARIRLAWEFTGDWFPWTIDPQAGSTRGTAEQFKECWKFIYLTMEEVNPHFEWVWCATVGFDHFDPGLAFPHYPGEEFFDRGDNTDKLLVDYISVDVYDADGECYFRDEHSEKEESRLRPGYWNTRDQEREAAFQHFRAKVFEGRGNLAQEGESKTYGLRYFKALADKHKLPLAVSEWGPWANYVPKTGANAPVFLRSAAFGGDDNPEFIDGLFKWNQENEVAYSVLFEFYNGGEGDTVDHTLLPGYWNSSRENRPRVSLYPSGSSFSQITDQIHPRAAKAYLRNLNEK